MLKSCVALFLSVIPQRFRRGLRESAPCGISIGAPLNSSGCTVYKSGLRPPRKVTMPALRTFYRYGMTKRFMLGSNEHPVCKSGLCPPARQRHPQDVTKHLSRLACIAALTLKGAAFALCSLFSKICQITDRCFKGFGNFY